MSELKRMILKAGQKLALCSNCGGQGQYEVGTGQPSEWGGELTEVVTCDQCQEWEGFLTHLADVAEAASQVPDAEHGELKDALTALKRELDGRG